MELCFTVVARGFRFGAAQQLLGCRAQAPKPKIGFGCWGLQTVRLEAGKLQLLRVSRDAAPLVFCIEVTGRGAEAHGLCCNRDTRGSECMFCVLCHSLGLGPQFHTRTVLCTCLG